jgi:hypothetical protein
MGDRRVAENEGTAAAAQRKMPKIALVPAHCAQCRSEGGAVHDLTRLTQWPCTVSRAVRSIGNVRTGDIRFKDHMHWVSLTLAPPFKGSVRNFDLRHLWYGNRPHLLGGRSFVVDGENGIR